jgi:hypothetical protein
MKHKIIPYIILAFPFSQSHATIHSAEMPQALQEEPAQVQQKCIHQHNEEKFNAIRELNLPLGQYAIVSSGPLGIRNLREIGDIDIIVSETLWQSIAARYGIIDKDGVIKVDFPGDIIEAFHEGSFYTKPKNPNAPTIAERIDQAEIIDGLPFETLEHVLYYKRKMNREKDIKDITLIENWLRERKETKNE